MQAKRNRHSSMSIALIFLLAWRASSESPGGSLALGRYCHGLFVTRCFWLNFDELRHPSFRITVIFIACRVRVEICYHHADDSCSGCC
jgi:hypothetical protein